MNILNTFFYTKDIQNPENLCETIFKSYINVLLSQYGQKDTNDNVYNVLKVRKYELFLLTYYLKRCIIVLCN